jgi:hypothetical protein
VSASEIRDEVARQHVELGELLDGVEALAARFAKSMENDSSLGRELRDRGLVLYDKFAAHLDSEQALLEPPLRKSGRAGERLAIRLRNEHHEQRELLKYLVARLEQQPEPTVLIARELQHFAGYLRYEMAHEEETLLSPSVLKDASDWRVPRAIKARLPSRCPAFNLRKPLDSLVATGRVRSNPAGEY